MAKKKSGNSTNSALVNTQAEMRNNYESSLNTKSVRAESGSKKNNEPPKASSKLSWITTVIMLVLIVGLGVLFVVNLVNTFKPISKQLFEVYVKYVNSDSIDSIAALIKFDSEEERSAFAANEAYLADISKINIKKFDVLFEDDCSMNFKVTTEIIHDDKSKEEREGVYWAGRYPIVTSDGSVGSSWSFMSADSVVGGGNSYDEDFILEMFDNTMTEKDGVKSYALNFLKDIYKPASIKKVVLPEGITRIESNAFANFSAIESITLPDSLERIGVKSFWNCSALKTFENSDGVSSIGWNAFGNTAWMDEQADGIVTFGKVVYSYKGSISDGFILNVPNGIVSISDHAFEGRTQITGVNFNGVKRIGSKAFAGCGFTLPLSALEGIYYAENAFEGCTLQ